MRFALCLVAALAGAGGCTSNNAASAPDARPIGPDAGPGTPAWLSAVHVLVQGVGLDTMECRGGICPHNENTDYYKRGSTIFLVHRTAMSQILGPNSSLRISRSDDNGQTWQLQAILPAPSDRDLRDPHFFEVGGKLGIEALTRLPVTSTRDSNVDTITVGTFSDDGKTWSAFEPLAPETWSFWRPKLQAGVWYSAAYEDGDKSVKLFRSSDGHKWDAGAVIYGVAADTPLETELVFMPSGRMLALVRMDGTDAELLGANGRLRTKVCWATAPYDHFDCPQEFTDQRLDGPVAFFHGGKLYVIARKHLPGGDDRKRMTLFAIGGTLEGGPLTISELGDFPSGGDTAYAGVADLDASHTLVVWYSSDISDDRPWLLAILLAADIWQGTIDWTQVPGASN
jgi:hypothetical protein